MPRNCVYTSQVSRDLNAITADRSPSASSAAPTGAATTEATSGAASAHSATTAGLSTAPTATPTLSTHATTHGFLDGSHRVLVPAERVPTLAGLSAGLIAGLAWTLTPLLPGLSSSSEELWEALHKRVGGYPGR